MKKLILICGLLGYSIAFAGEKSLMNSNVSLRREQYDLQKMVTKPALQYKNPLKELSNNPVVNFATGVAIDYAINKNNEEAYYKNDVSNLRLSR